MKKLVGAALLVAALALTGCGDAADEVPATEAEEATLDPGTGEADFSATTEGAGDMSSAAGAGAATAAMDGGRAGDDGAPPVEEGEGGPSDAMSGEADAAD